MNVLNRFKKISTFLFDMDGVITDGMLLVLPNGVMARRVNIKDGYALQLAVKRGYHVAVISGGSSPEMEQRMHSLGIIDFFSKVEDKHAFAQAYLAKLKIDSSEVIFMGDDMPDVEVMRNIGLACCPQDAVQEVKNVAAYISAQKGGEGCVRDVIEKVMKLQNKWAADTTIKSQ